MAFVGKQQRQKTNKKADVQVSIKDGRIGLVFRSGIVAPGTTIDVLVGTEEDFGKFMIVTSDSGKSTKQIGKSGKICSWSAMRAAAKIYPNVTKYQKATATKLEDGSLLIDLNLGTDEVTAEDLGL